MTTQLHKILLFRITHIENIPHILKNGITHKDSPNFNPKYKDIGDNSLIYKREEKIIYVNNGEEFKNEHKIIKPGKFIPFYFGVRMPMLYVIQKGYNNVSKQNAENIIYCVCSLQSIINCNLEFYFTDGHATNNLSSCFDKNYVQTIMDIVDFKAVKSKDWTVERDLKRRMEAECLVSFDIPVACIVGYGCFSNTAKEELIKMGIEEKIIGVRPQYYF